MNIYANDNGNGPATYTVAPGLADGTHRVRLSYNWFEKRSDFAFDLNYAGGAFAADVTAPPMNVSDLYGLDGWPTEPARIYFGGDDAMILKDFSVNVTSPALLLGDFNTSGTIARPTG